MTNLAFLPLVPRTLLLAPHLLRSPPNRLLPIPKHSTTSLARQRRRTRRMRGIRVTSRAQILSDLLGSRRGVEAEDGAVEELESGDGLVVGDFMACFAIWGKREMVSYVRTMDNVVVESMDVNMRWTGRKSDLLDASEGEVAILPRLTILHAIHHHRCVARRVELLGVGVLYSLTYCLSTKPIADVVRIAVDHRHSDRRVEDRFQVFFEVRVDEVTGLLEGIVDIVVTERGIICVDAERGLRLGQVEKIDHV
jgi:hypothetical protein